MLHPLILVDGPVSPFRTHVADSLASYYHTNHDRGHIGTLPEMYVRMMTPAIDREFPVVIECSWVTQEHHAHLLSPIAKLVLISTQLNDEYWIDLHLAVAYSV